MNSTYREWKRIRINSINSLRSLADELDLIQRGYDKAQYASTILSVTSGLLSIISPLTGGTSLILAGVAGSAGVSFGADIYKGLHENKLVKNAQQIWEGDLQQTEKLLNFIAKSTPQNSSALDKIVDIMEAATIPGTIMDVNEKLGKGVFGFQSAKCKKMSDKMNASGAGKAIKTGTAVLGIALLTINIVHLVMDKGKMSYNDKADVLRELAKAKERELQMMETLNLHKLM